MSDKEKLMDKPLCDFVTFWDVIGLLKSMVTFYEEPDLAETFSVIPDENLKNVSAVNI